MDTQKLNVLDIIDQTEYDRLIRDSKRKPLDRVLEKITPILAFLFVLTPIVLSIIAHELAAIYILTIVVYFLYKSVSIAFFFMVGLRKIRKASQIDWKKKLDGLKNIDETIRSHKEAIQLIQSSNFDEYKNTQNLFWSKSKLFNSHNSQTKRSNFLLSFLYFKEKSKAIRFLNSEIEELMNLRDKTTLKAEEIRHVIIIPYVKEPIDLLRETLDRLKNQSIGSKNITIVLASEAAVPNGIVVSELLKSEYINDFADIWITAHQLQPYDVVSKSSNMNWAGRVAYKMITDKGYDPEKTTLTSCDSDSKFDLDYFSMLTYYYITNPLAKYKMFSGAMVFYNNIWRVHFFARIQNSLYTINNVALLARPDKYIYVSTYSLSFWLMKEIDFWSPHIVPEDYHIFFKGLYTHDKYVSAIPMPVKIISDAAEGETFWDSFSSNYNQFRRWSWGVSDHGWMIKNLFTNFWRKSIRSKYMTVHTIFDWTVGQGAAVIILMGGFLPRIVRPINPEFINSPSGALLPGIVDGLMRFTIVALVVIIFLNFYLRPIPNTMPWWKKPFTVLEWIIFPFTGIILATIPSFDAQTKLLFEKYMEHIVTAKKSSDKQNNEPNKIG